MGGGALPNLFYLFLPCNSYRISQFLPKTLHINICIFFCNFDVQKSGTTCPNWGNLGNGRKNTFFLQEVFPKAFILIQQLSVRTIQLLTHSPFHRCWPCGRDLIGAGSAFCRQKLRVRSRGRFCLQRHSQLIWQDRPLPRQCQMYLSCSFIKIFRDTNLLPSDMQHTCILGCPKTCSLE